MPSAVVSLIDQYRRRRTERVIYALLAMLGLGLASIALAIIGVKTATGARFVALSFLTALASFVAGAALGLLFGLPGRAGEGGGAGATGGYVDRTTLEQIADWLTKIIVGVALTQVPAIERRLNRVTLDVTHDLYCPHAGPAGCGRLVGGSIIAAFAIGGFLIAYLWMRRWFILEMLDRDKQITQAEGAIAKARDEARVQASPDIAPGQVGAVAGQADPVALAIAADARKVATGAAQATAATIKPGSQNDDPWLSAFGGSAVSGDAGITAKVTDAADWPGWFEVNLTLLGLTPDAQARLAGQAALIYLHPTFGPKVRRVGFGADGRARLQLFAWGSFTVGAILPDGPTLELDLAQLPGVPDAFRNR